MIEKEIGQLRMLMVFGRTRVVVRLIWMSMYNNNSIFCNMAVEKNDIVQNHQTHQSNNQN